jgi:hypothetical protein
VALTRLQKLEKARDQITDRLVEITASTQISYSMEGKSVSKTEYMEALTRQLKELDELVTRAGGEGAAVAPFCTRAVVRAV